MDTTRRGFLGLLGAMAASGLGRVEASTTTRRFVLNECFIAGFRYHDGPAMAAKLRRGQLVQLVVEPNNPHDQWAVRIDRGQHTLGYLPRNQNEPVSRLLQQGAPVSCRITATDMDAELWEAVQVQVSIQMQIK